MNQSNLKSNNSTPLLIYQPFNLLVFLSFYSPIILSICIVSMSFLFQNFKGFIYLGFLLGVCIVRNFIYLYSGSGQQVLSNNSICDSIQYSKYGNLSFSSFVFAFTIMYLSIPMFLNENPNFWVFLVLIVYFCFDIFIKLYKKCTLSIRDLFLNILLGSTASTLIISLMYLGGSSQYLFFNEISSNKESCSQPKKQTFKCSLYKNGELVSGI